eukprot:gene14455-12138_t
MTTPCSAGTRYTAWSSVATLIKKELLVKTNSPARYSLTATGRDLSQRLKSAGSGTGDADANAAAAAGDGGGGGGAAAAGGGGASADGDGAAAAVGGKACKSSSTAAVVLCDNCEEEVASLKCEECDELYCDDCNYNTHRNARKKLHTRTKMITTPTPTPTTSTAAATPLASRLATSSDPAPPPTGHQDQDQDQHQHHAAAVTPASLGGLSPNVTSPEPESATAASTTSTAARRRRPVFSPIDNEEDLDMLSVEYSSPRPSYDAVSSTARRQRPPRNPSPLSTAPPTTAASAALSSLRSIQEISEKVGSAYTSADSGGSSGSGGGGGGAATSASSYPSGMTAAQSAAAQTSPVKKRKKENVYTAPSFAMEPGAYDIVLVVDTMEQTGSRKDKGVMQRKLASMGVQTIVRSLALGDFLWFAKERVQPIIGRLELPESREVVLDHVIERKRMDDLVGSIMDGRFEEQKFRFANAEIKNGIYLIEDHGSINNKRLPATTLKQAIANTQVQGDFFVKHTADTASTIAYLVLMTRKIQDMF